ncbi:beta-lactamase [Oesophagostomum dentatum]|uniref:Beta-lactamase n=1 Tax=Oesophagostomum dentatum TaxID=61180 RepID=A0A0B1TV65_OESDE|nr:beta-lactamase [Oesophagostomum dentatum]
MSRRVVGWVVLVALLAYAVQLCFYRADEELHVDGEVDEAFKGVREAFSANFLEGWERGGASFVVYHNGRKVVDLWGGYADRDCERLWKRDTLNVAFSSTKAFAALCVAKLVDEGHLKYDDLVTKFWPEFGKHGKGNVTVRWLLGHRTPNWPPGTETGYHAITYGWLADQIVRRVDPKHRSVGVYFREEFAEKYNLDFYIGLPHCEAHRVSRLTIPSAWDTLQEIAHKPSDFNVFRFIHQMWTNGPLSRVGHNVPWIAFMNRMTLNNPDFYGIEQAGVLGIGTARAMAELFERFRVGELMSPATFKALTSDYVLQRDVVTGAYVPRGPGLMIKKLLHNNVTVELLGHSGYGGQNVRVDLANNLTIAYMSNALKVGFGDTARTYVRLLHSVYDVIIGPEEI